AAQGVRVLRSSRLDYKVSVPTKEDVKTLIDGSNGRLRAMLIVSALCGLRASETRGLRWADVDVANGFVHVRQRADFYGSIGEPKSSAGHRSVPAGPFVLTRSGSSPEGRANSIPSSHRTCGRRACGTRPGWYPAGLHLPPRREACGPGGDQ